MNRTTSNRRTDRRDPIVGALLSLPAAGEEMRADREPRTVERPDGYRWRQAQRQPRRVDRAEANRAAQALVKPRPRPELVAPWWTNPETAAQKARIRSLQGGGRERAAERFAGVPSRAVVAIEAHEGVRPSKAEQRRARRLAAAS